MSELIKFWNTPLESRLINACRTIPPDFLEIEDLLNQGADPNMQSECGTVFSTILDFYGMDLGDGEGMDARAGGLYLPDITRLLLKHGADPNILDLCGQSLPLEALFYAAPDQWTLKAAMLLLQAGADSNVTDSEERLTLLDRTLEYADLEATVVPRVIMKNSDYSLAGVTDWERTSFFRKLSLLLKEYGGKEWDELFSPVLLHIPHASMLMPKDATNEMIPDKSAIREALHELTDHWTDDMFFFQSFPNRIVFPVSRLICDVERFREDELEPMASMGMGAIYTRLPSFEILRTPSHNEREKILKTWYDPHHIELEKRVDDILNTRHGCLIVDAHSFSSKPLPHEPDQSSDRPDFCIGSDSFHTPFELLSLFVEIIKHAGFSVEINKPFAGAMVPSKHYRADPRVWAIMIEVNRKVYMDEGTTVKTDQYDDIKALILRLLLSARKLFNQRNNNVKNTVETAEARMEQ